MNKSFITRRQSIIALVFISISAFILFTIVNILYDGSLDLGWYRLWAADINNNGNLFGIYEVQRANSIALDYPPLYLFMLTAVGWIYNIFHVPLQTDGIYMFDNFAMNFFPVLSCIAVGWVVYFTVRKYGEVLALVCGIAWILNPACIVNGVIWGQTDVILICILILSFHYLDEDRIMLATALFAIAVLTKYQAVLFGPVYLMQLIKQTKLTKESIKRTLASILYSGGIVLAVFLPFMVGSGRLSLIKDLYTGGQQKYPYFSLEAMNIYGSVGLDWSASNRARDTTHYFMSGVTYAELSNIIIAITVMVLILFTFFLKRNLSWINCFILMQTIFMFTTRMHERYQFIAIPFIFYAYIKTRFKPFLGSFILVTLITMINPLLLLLKDHPGSDFLNAHYNQMFIIGSKINIAIYFITFICCMYYYFYPTNNAFITKLNKHLFHKPTNEFFAEEKDNHISSTLTA